MLIFLLACVAAVAGVVVVAAAAAALPDLGADMAGMAEALLPAAGHAELDDAAELAWRLGDGLTVGDSYTYEVCHSIHAAEATHPDPCYTLRMDFVHSMTHHAYGPAWIVVVGFDGDSTVMLLDHNTMTMHPTSAWDVWLAGSIQDTVLHLAPYGERNLEVGAYWGEIDAYFYSVPLSIMSRDGDGSILGYDTTAESRTVIISGMPFPEYSRWHDPHNISADPRIMHEYELVR